MVNTLLRTYKLAKERLQKRWWLYLIALFVWNLFQDRIFAWANAKIDEGATGMTAPLVEFILWFNSPEKLTVSLAVIIILAIVIHAYWDARKAKSGTISENLPTDNQSAIDQLSEKQKQISNLITHAEAVSVQCEAYKEQLKLAKEQVENLTAQGELCKKDAEEKENKYQSLQLEFKAFKQDHGRCVIGSCAVKEELLNLSVAVQYIVPEDRHLAEQINKLFGFGWPGSRWKTQEPRHVLQGESNPTPARIVVFSDDHNGYALKTALGEYELLDEPVDYAGKKLAAADITIIIFPTKRPSHERATLAQCLLLFCALFT